MGPQSTDIRIILAVILFVWVGISTRAVVTGNYEGLEIITPVVLGAIGPLFALLMIQSNNRRNGNGASA